MTSNLQFSKALETARQAAGLDPACNEPPRRPTTPRPDIAFAAIPEASPQAGDLHDATAALDGLYEQQPVSEPDQAGHAGSAAALEELVLAPDLTPADLHRIRRAYALANHPDRVACALREEATRCMTNANALIDRALEEAKGSAR